MSPFTVLALFGLLLMVLSLVAEFKDEPKKNPCIRILETRIVKMTGALNYDQCYVVTTDPDENVLLHTVQCKDTLIFKHGRRN